MKRECNPRIAIIIAIALTIYLSVFAIIEGLFIITIGRMNTLGDDEDFQGSINPDNLAVLTKTHEPYCSSHPVKVIFCIKSSVANFQRRQILRNTWLSHLRKSRQYRYIFVVGLPQQTNNELSQFLLYEKSTFQDIVQGNFTDSYRNITLKSVFLLTWVHQQCPEAQNVMSVDDDTFINIGNLETFLKKTNHTPNLLAGHVLEQKKPFRSKFSKWYASYKSYPNNNYPQFVMGAGYIMSSDVVLKLLQCVLTEPLFHLDDVFITGICARKVNIKPHYYPEFRLITLFPFACFMKNAITGPDMTPEGLLRIWNEFENKQYFSSLLCILSWEWQELLLYGFLLLILIAIGVLIHIALRKKNFILRWKGRVINF